MTKLAVLDLFSGIGGFSLGLERTGGFETTAFCEIDNYCQRVLHKHWPDVYIHSDIRTLGAQHFEQYRKPDLICGGFPCQDISVAGKQVGISGERSGLWFEMLRIIEELRPRWVLVENVPNLRTKGADEVLAGLEAEGYSCWPTVVGAWAVGGQIKRNRVWILASSIGARLSRLEQDAWLLSATKAPSTEFDYATTGIGSPLDEYCRRLPHRNGLSVGMVRSQLKPLGNSVVPQIPELFGRFILAAEAV